MKSFLAILTILATGAKAEHSMSYTSDEFTCFIDECGCPNNFLKTWCSKTHVITSEWCNKSPENCNQCSGSVCYESDHPEVPPVEGEHHCYINQCGCPGSFTEFWCSEDTAKITSPWCGESEEHCGMCGGSFCSADLAIIPVAPTGECFISQCGCPGSFGQEWCTETAAKITSEFCNMNEDHCGNCAGTYCPVYNEYFYVDVGYCSAPGVFALPDAEFNTASAEACWAQCAGKYPNLAGIDWWPQDWGECYCGQTCECMADTSTAWPSYTESKTLIRADTSNEPPEACPVVYDEYMYVDVGICTNTTLNALNEYYFGYTDSADACWNGCTTGVGYDFEQLFSIGWFTEDEVSGYCYCYDSCDCMKGASDDPATTATSYSYSYTSYSESKILYNAGVAPWPEVCPASLEKAAETKTLPWGVAKTMVKESRGAPRRWASPPSTSSSSSAGSTPVPGPSSEMI